MARALSTALEAAGNAELAALDDDLREYLVAIVCEVLAQRAARYLKGEKGVNRGNGVIARPLIISPRSLSRSRGRFAIPLSRIVAGADNHTHATNVLGLPGVHGPVFCRPVPNPESSRIRNNPFSASSETAAARRTRTSVKRRWRRCWGRG